MRYVTSINRRRKDITAIVETTLDTFMTTYGKETSPRGYIDICIGVRGDSQYFY
jgi:hypothetical protein